MTQLLIWKHVPHVVCKMWSKTKILSESERGHSRAQARLVPRFVYWNLNCLKHHSCPQLVHIQTHDSRSLSILPSRMPPLSSATSRWTSNHSSLNETIQCQAATARRLFQDCSPKVLPLISNLKLILQVQPWRTDGWSWVWTGPSLCKIEEWLCSAVNLNVRRQLDFPGWTEQAHCPIVE